MNKKPVVLVVMDGVGETPETLGNMVMSATTPTLDELKANHPWQVIKAHGGAVGLPSDDDMGNSEVGHNALGCGQVYSQGAKLVNESIDSGKIYASETWQELVGQVKANASTLHFIGLLSDGNVHSNISHLIAMLKQAKVEGVKRVRCHILLDGRDVPATSAPEYVQQLEDVLASLNDDTFDGCIASGGGRMKVTMDRYQANWAMVEAGWNVHVHGEGRQFATALEAIETYRAETGALDQDLPAFVIAKDGQPVGKMADGDSVILYNFRGDRAQEISMAFDGDASFDKFDRGMVPQVKYAGMLQYDGDLNIPNKFLVNPPEIKDTLTELLVKAGVNEYACSETQKYGHVTYFWNGNRSGKFDEKLETYYEVPSDVVPFEQRPWMKCAEITDKLIECLKSGEYKCLRVNFPNGDMVGHTGNLLATRCSMEALDLQLKRLLDVVDSLGGVALITADHGNADEMYEIDKKTGAPKQNKDGSFKAKTSHTLNPVPFIVYDNFSADKYSVKLGREDFGLSSVAATTVNLLGFEAPEIWDESMVELK